MFWAVFCVFFPLPFLAANKKGGQNSSQSDLGLFLFEDHTKKRPIILPILAHFIACPVKHFPSSCAAVQHLAANQTWGPLKDRRSSAGTEKVARDKLSG